MSRLAILLLLLLAACAAPPRVPPRSTALEPRAELAAPTPLVLVTLPAEPADRLAQAVGVPFELPLGEAISVGASGITVRFTAISEDSRCPVDAHCLWAGRAVIAVEVILPGAEAQLFSLAIPGDLTPDAPEMQLFGPYSLRLVELEPYPAGPNGETGPYVATLLLEQR